METSPVAEVFTGGTIFDPDRGALYKMRGAEGGAGAMKLGGTFGGTGGEGEGGGIGGEELEGGSGAMKPVIAAGKAAFIRLTEQVEPA